MEWDNQKKTIYCDESAYETRYVVLSEAVYMFIQIIPTMKPLD